MQIDDVGVTVADGRVTVRMTVRFRTFPALVLVLVMLVVNM